VLANVSLEFFGRWRNPVCTENLIRID
jgi:hypothetical protein